MLQPIREKIAQYEAANDIHQFGIIRDAAKEFLELFPTEATPDNGLDEGIQLIRHLQSLNYLGSLPQYEHEYALHNELLALKIKIFKRCIPESHGQIRGLTELILGMKEDQLK